ncbi:MAG: peptidyl-tRNA hydrolase Pth2 [Conexivisphaera sp.]
MVDPEERGYAYRYKQVIVVRTDIAMGRGKLAAQVAHAAVSALKEAEKSRPGWAAEWLSEGQPKIVTKVKDLDELMRRYEAARAAGIPTALIADRGLTQLEPGTITCVGIGPAPVGEVDRVTGDLKLL